MVFCIFENLPEDLSLELFYMYSGPLGSVGSFSKKGSAKAGAGMEGGVGSVAP